MKLIICSTLLFVSTMAMADLSGKWKGEGKGWKNSGWKADCDFISFHVSQSTEQLNINFDAAQCGDFAWELGPTTLEIRNGKLFYHRKEIGKIDDNSLSAEFQEYGSATTKYEIKLQQDNTLYYKQEYVDPNETFIHEGILKR